MRGRAIDRLALHEELWKRADHFGKLEIYQKLLAEELGVTQATMSLIIKDLVGDGRIKKVSAKKRNVGTYVVRDPTLFEHEFEPVHVPGINVERCARCGDLEQVGRHTLKIP